MIIKPKQLYGVFEIIFKPHIDHRGSFMRTFDDELFNTYAINRKWIQENQSISKLKYTIRGLHFQLPPYSETKLVRVLKGSIIDVFVDLRKDSKTFGSWDYIELSSENNKMILIPQGFAHGFCTLENNCEVLYKTDNIYAPDYESGIIWNDDILKINWPTKNPIISEKDCNLQSFQEFKKNIGGLNIE